MATEIAIIPLRDGRKPDDPNSEGGQAWKDTLDTLAEQKGMQRNYWGRHVENPAMLRLLVDWDSVDAHIAFTKTDTYKPFIERAGFLCHMDQAQLFHVHLKPHPHQNILSDAMVGATEIVTAYFPEDYSDSDRKQTEENIGKLLKAVESNTKTCHGYATGWAVEKLPIPTEEEKQSGKPSTSKEKGTAFVALLGWDSVDAHLAFRDNQAFKDNIHYLREAKDLKTMTVVHTSCVETQPI